MLRGRLFPDNTFTIGYVPPEKKKKAERKYDRGYEKQYHRFQVDGEYDDLHIPSMSQEELRRFWLSWDKPVKPSSILIGGVAAVLHLLISFPSALRFIFSPELSQNPKVTVRKGLKGITVNGKRTVKNAAYLLQKEHGRKRLGFLTTTVPSCNSEQLYVIASEWAEIKRRFHQSIRRRLQKQGAPDEIVEVTEIQSKRLERRQEFAPHSHICYVASRTHRPDWYITAEELRELWGRSINCVLRKYELPELNDFKASIDCQRVRKSVRNYMGKYITKGSGACEEYIEKGYEASIPRHWWSVTTSLKLRIKQQTRSLDAHLCEYLLLNHEVLCRSGQLEYCQDIIITLQDESQFIVGCCGRMSISFSEEICG